MTHSAAKVVRRNIRMNGSSGTRGPGTDGDQRGQRLARLDGHRGGAAGLDSQGISQGPTEALEGDGHEVAVLEAHAIAEAQGAGAEIMDVDVARPPVRRVLEVVVLDITQAVTHLALAGRNRLRPQGAAAALDR